MARLRRPECDPPPDRRVGQRVHAVRHRRSRRPDHGRPDDQAGRRRRNPLPLRRVAARDPLGDGPGVAAIRHDVRSVGRAEPVPGRGSLHRARLCRTCLVRGRVPGSRPTNPDRHVGGSRTLRARRYGDGELHHAHGDRSADRRHRDPASRRREALHDWRRVAGRSSRRAVCPRRVGDRRHLSVAPQSPNGWRGRRRHGWRRRRPGHVPRRTAVQGDRHRCTGPRFGLVPGLG